MTHALLSDSIATTTDGEDLDTHKAIASLIDEMRGQGTLPSLQPERVLSDKQLERLGKNQATIDAIAREIKWQRKQKAQKKQSSPSHNDAGVALQDDQQPNNIPNSAGDQGLPNAALFAAGWEIPNMDVEMGFQQRPISEGDFKAISTLSIANRATPSNEIERITNPGEIKIPRALKTSKQTDPVEPYKSWDEKQNILNRGLAAGSGLALWTGPRVKKWGSRTKTPDGRFRSGTAKKSALSKSQIQMFS
jgi:hypothetical protein